jgi:cytochrome oxidase Cu insertion factor (SCO1/SenC/PrrC family)
MQKLSNNSQQLAVSGQQSENKKIRGLKDKKSGFLNFLFSQLLISCLLLFTIHYLRLTVVHAQPLSPYAIEKLSGQKAPDFTLKDINGNSVSLSSFKGKVILLNFWAT